MKIVNACWEKRNLEVDCNEVIIEPHDTADSLTDSFSEFETDYTVVKVPGGMTEISFCLQKHGYSFIEMITTVSFELTLPSLSEDKQRILETLTCDKMDLDELEYLYEIIGKGMYVSDRIALDPFFSRKQANMRYINWIRDMLKDGANVYKVSNNKDIIGFYMQKNNRSRIHHILGGIYPQYQKEGFGFSLIYLPLKQAIDEKAKSLFTAFSSNNPRISSVFLSMPLSEISQDYVYIKHI